MSFQGSGGDRFGCTYTASVDSVFPKSVLSITVVLLLDPMFVIVNPK